MDKTKKCLICGKELSESSFEKNRITKDGLYFACKECSKDNSIKKLSEIKIYPTSKKCTKCGEEKNINLFNKSSVNHDGLQSHCKECQAKANFNLRFGINKTIINTLDENGPITLPTSKKCCKCGEIKELDMFYNQTKSKDGKQPYCKDCQTDYDKKLKEKIKSAKLKPIFNDDNDLDNIIHELADLEVINDNFFENNLKIANKTIEILKLENNDLIEKLNKATKALKIQLSIRKNILNK